ncbi:MAG TPA: carboxypeptidase regulatory-like domain-containing protein [Blastocatellia bacterium]|nr:carboxypeptidase regulatory-like domain-containing protein [Blastocatellia bacterium]
MTARGLAGAFALLLIFSHTASAQNNQLRGKVRSTNGTTVNNAIVELRLGGAMIAQTVTRNDGDFAFTNLSPGEYEVTVLMAGYDPGAEIARFEGGMREGTMQVINLEVYISPKAELILAPPATTFVQDVPKAARTAYEKGISKLRDGKSDEGVALLREAVAAFDDYFDAHLALGKELFRRGKDGDALEFLERARQINNREGAVYHMFGMVMLKQGKFGVAEYAFREACRLNENNAAPLFYHAVALIEVAVRTSDESQRVVDLEEAERKLDRAWELSNKRVTRVYLQRARIHESRGDNAAAARELESYLKAEPSAKNAPAIKEMISKLRAKK